MVLLSGRLYFWQAGLGQSASGNSHWQRGSFQRDKWKSDTNCTRRTCAHRGKRINTEKKRKAESGNGGEGEGVVASSLWFDLIRPQAGRYTSPIHRPFPPSRRAKAPLRRDGGRTNKTSRIRYQPLHSWLISGVALRLLAIPAPEARQIAAHGETMGWVNKTIQAPAGATENRPSRILSPHPGLDSIPPVHPRFHRGLFSFVAPRLSQPQRRRRVL